MTAPDGHGGEGEESAVERRAIGRFQHGDIEALHFLYTRYASDVFSYVRGLVGGDARAAEVTKDVFRTSLPRAAEYKRENELFRVWILGLARDAAQGP